jgi:FkbM family methyltransferase
MGARIIQILILCVLVEDGRLIYVSPGPRLLALAVAGRSQCSFGRTMESADSVRRIQETEAQMNRASRLLVEEGGLQLWDTPRGQYWLAGHARDLSSNKYALVLAEQQEKIYGTGEHFVRRGDVVLDCGADYGSFTRSALWAGAAVVVSIEPSPQKEVCLRRTFATEIHEGRVIVVAKGVWNKEASLTLYDDSLVEHRAASGTVVPLTTIDKLVTDLKLSRVDFIKMDIEGAEKQALAGGRHTIEQFKPRLAIATEHLPDDAEKIPQVIRSIVPGYHIECGPCEYADNHIRPQVLRFY